MQAHELPRPRKQFGQNFLQDPLLIQCIIDCIRPEPGQHIVEIGPGRGALSFPLLKVAQPYTALEIDRDLVTYLKPHFQAVPDAQLISMDALDFDFSTLQPQPLRVIGNLPYNISSPLLLHLMDYLGHIQDIHVMLQTEMAERIVAAPDSKDYGRLSVMLQYFCEAESLLDIPPHSFYPAPKVNSCFIRLIPHGQNSLNATEFERFSQVVKHAFQQRRKTLSNSLKGICSPEQFEQAGIDSKRRAETLSVAEFIQLSR